MSNKIKAALITSLIIGALVSIVIAGYYNPMLLVPSFGIICMFAMFYVVYDNILHYLNGKDEHKIKGQDER